MADVTLEVAFDGEIWFWRGPAPFYFVTVPDDASVEIRALAPIVSYGWGMIAVRVGIGDSVWETAMFPKDGRYVVPIKASVRLAEGLAAGDTVHTELSIPP